jgi:hypothetical protein
MIKTFEVKRQLMYAIFEKDGDTSKAVFFFTQELEWLLSLAILRH